MGETGKGGERRVSDGDAAAGEEGKQPIQHNFDWTLIEKTGVNGTVALTHDPTGDPLCACLHQHGHHAVVGPADRVVQRGAALAVPRPDVGVLLEQDLDDAVLALHGGDHQGSGPVVVSAGGVGAVVDQALACLRGEGVRGWRDGAHRLVDGG
jgi:hypothetical protein